MHWNDQFASNARVDTVVNPATDPVSGQLESKHTPVIIKPVATAWEGFLITRHDFNVNTEYWVRSVGRDCYRYLIAGNTPLDWSNWAKYIMRKNSPNSDWLEYQDTSIGRYRAATGERRYIAKLYVYCAR